MTGENAIMKLFPALVAGSFKITSPSTKRYNCVAWAAGCAKKRWDPAKPFYWPEGIPRNDSIDTMVRVFERLGYELCQRNSTELEDGWEKVAIYGEGYEFSHVARQKPNGNWTSKLGNLEDIDHDTLSGLCSNAYGKVLKVMKRKRSRR